MKVRRFATDVCLVALAGVAVIGCGSSTSSPSSSSAGGGTSSQAPIPTVAIPGGSPFCTQASSVINQLSGISRSLTSVSPGATPSITSFKQVIAAVTAAIDGLDSSAPGAIASSFHTVRAAYDQLNTQAQSATTLQGASAVFSALGAQPIKDADAAISAYLKGTCGITSPSP